MNSLFPFMRDNAEPADNQAPEPPPPEMVPAELPPELAPAESPPPEPAPPEAPPLAPPPPAPAPPPSGPAPEAANAPLAPPPMAPLADLAAIPEANGASTAAEALVQMVDALGGFLPDDGQGNPVPASSVSATSITERALAIGNRRGLERRGHLGAVELKGGRLDGTVRFQLWGETLDEVEAKTRQLHQDLLAAKDSLWASGFLRLVAEGTSLAGHLPDLNAWRQTADYRILYEYHYGDTDRAESLIARIPIHSDLEERDSVPRETTVVTDEMVRWDNEAAPILIVRGRAAISRLSALTFVPSTVPGGGVTLTRSYEGAAGTPTAFATLADFVAAVSGPGAAERHAQVSFGTLSDFLSEFASAGSSLTLGDWDEDTTPDDYEPQILAFSSAIALPRPTDWLEVAYQESAFDEVAVAYLRAE